MNAKKVPSSPKRIKMSQPHKHGRSHCLSLLRKLSAYIDNELPSNICREVRRHLGACPNCEIFISSLQKTVTLFHYYPTPRLTAMNQRNMRRAILEAIKAEGNRRSA